MATRKHLMDRSSDGSGNNIREGVALANSAGMSPDASLAKEAG